MAATSCLIIYYTDSKLMRGVVYPADDSEIADTSKWLRLGESGLVVKYSDLPPHPALPTTHAENCRIYLASQVGAAPHNGRCALIPKGITPTAAAPFTVQQVIIADPAVDTLPDHGLHLNATVVPGSTFDGTTFTPLPTPTFNHPKPPNRG